jgi:hypothetical protein
MDLIIKKVDKHWELWIDYKPFLRSLDMSYREKSYIWSVVFGGIEKEEYIEIHTGELK